MHRGEAVDEREMEQQFPFYNRDEDGDDDDPPRKTKKLPPNIGDEMSEDEIIGSCVEFEKENAVNDSKESSARANSSSNKKSRAKKRRQGKDDDDILEGDATAAGVKGGGKGAKESAPTKTKKKATAKKKSTGGKKKTAATPVLGSMPAKPIVQSIPPKPTKTGANALLKGPVGTKVSSSNLKSNLVTANERITSLESYITTTVQPCLDILHASYEQSVDIGWNYMQQQDQVLAETRAELQHVKDQLQQQNLQIIQLQSDKEMAEIKLEAAKSAAVAAKRDIDTYKSLLKNAQKNSGQISAEEQAMLDDRKTMNAIELARERDMSKVRAREIQKDNDEMRNHANFNNSKNNYNHKKGNEWNLSSSVVRMFDYTNALGRTY